MTLKNLNKLIRYLYDKKESTLYFYDKKTESVLIYEEEWAKIHDSLKVHHLDDYSIDEMPLSNFTALELSIIPLPKVSNSEVMSAFVQKNENDALKDCLHKKNSYNHFKELISEYNLEDEYNIFEENFYKQVIKEWAFINNVVYKKISKTQKRTLVEKANRIMEYEPWKYFSDQDHITIHFNDDEISYIVLGNAGSCYGLCVYFGEEGFKQLNLECILAEIDEKSILPHMIKNSYAIYFDYYDDLTIEEKDFLDSTLKEIKNIKYPSFHEFKIGRPFDYVHSNVQSQELTFALQMFLLFIREYSKKPRHYKDIFDLNVTIDKDYNVKYRKANNDQIDPPYFNELLLLEENNFKKGNHTYVFDLIGSPAPVIKDGEAYLPFIPIILDKNTKKIIYATPTVATTADYISPIYKDIKEFFTKTRAPKDIIALNPISNIVAALLLKDPSKVSMSPERNPIIEDFKEGLLDELLSNATIQKEYVQ